MREWSSLTDAFLDVQDALYDMSVDTDEFVRRVNLMWKRDRYAESEGIPSALYD